MIATKPVASKCEEEERRSIKKCARRVFPVVCSCYSHVEHNILLQSNSHNIQGTTTKQFKISFDIVYYVCLYV